MKIRISKRTVEALEPRAKRYIVWDERVAGFGVRVQPTGIKSYVLVYRLPGVGRSMSTQTHTLGRLGQITADQARELAADALELIRRGGDPQRDRRELRHRPTVAQLVEMYLAWLKMRAKPRSWADAKNVLELHAVPAIGKMAVADVRRADVVAIVRRLEEQGHPRTGGKVVQFLRAAFNRAELDEAPWNAMRAAGTNPCCRLQVNLGARRQRRFTIEELGRLGQALRAAAARGESPWLIGLILLWLLTGARNAEIRTARWADVDWQESRLRLPDSKTGPKSIWLSAAAIAVLRRVPRLNDNPYIIAGTKPGRSMVNPYKGWGRIMAEAGIEGATPHDLRRTFASMGLGQGLSLEQIGTLLGHSSVQTTRGYSFLDADPARASAALIGDGIRQLLLGPPAGTGPKDGSTPQ